VQFRWSDGKYVKLQEGEWRPFLKNKSFRKSFDNSPKYSKYLDEIGIGFTHSTRAELNLDDLFVYPDLRKVVVGQDPGQTSATVHSSDVHQFMLNSKYVCLIGGQQSGKTALARKLYRAFQQSGQVPLLLNGKDIKAKSSGSFVGAIEKAFVAQYDKNTLDAYKGLPIEKKALLFDDWHHVQGGPNQRAALLESAKKMFGNIVVLAGDIVRIDEIARAKREGNPFVGFTRCDIRPFSHLLRGQLIEKWLSLDRDLPPNHRGLVQEIERAEKFIRTLLGKKLLPSYPLVILTLLQAQEATKDTSAPSGTFGYLYEFLITKRLASVKPDAVAFDIRCVLLSRLANYLFEREQKQFTKSDLQEVVDEYYREHDLRLNSTELLEEFQKADIITSSDSSFRFYHRYYYYYFVARHFRDCIRLNKGVTALNARMREMADRIYYEEYLNILMFYLYLTGDAELIAYLTERAAHIYGTYSACDFDRHIEFVNRLYVSTPRLVLPAGSFEEEREKQRRGLDDIADDDADDVSNPEARDVIYADELKDIIKLNIAFKHLQLLGQILRNFPGSLGGATKLRLTRECYLLGLRTLRAILAIAENNLDDLRSYMAEIVREVKEINTENELARSTDEAVIWLTRRCAYAIVKRISDSVGLEVLEETYKHVLDGVTNDAPERSFKIIDFVVKLDHFGRFPQSEMEEVWQECMSNNFCCAMITELVVVHLSVVPLDDRTKQSVCDLLEIKLLRQLPSA
jgi:hypothetical protein